MKESLQQRFPYRRMKPEDQWRYYPNGQLIINSVWAQSSLGARSKRWDKRTDIRAAHHEKELDRISRENIAEDTEADEVEESGVKKDEVEELSLIHI